MKKRTRADKVSAEAVAEVVEDAVSVSLLHAGVNIITRIAQLRNFLCQQLHTLGRVAEDDALINL